MHVAPSYDFDRFSDADRREELKRLQRQATVLLDRELSVLEAVGLGKGARVLEIGCGPGFLTGALAQRAAPGEAMGIDTSAELLEVAQSVVQPQHPNLRFQAGNAYQTGLPEKGFDFVYSRLVFQHLKDPLLALQEARRVARPAGKVCVMDVDDGWLTLHPRSEAFEKFTVVAQRAQVANGGDRFVGRKLPGLMKRAGFSKVEAHVSFASSLELGLPAFLDITTRFKAIQIHTREADELLEQLQSELALQDPRELFGIVGAFFVVGTV